MLIDIDTLSEHDLRDLNHRIVERLRLMQQLRAHSAMMEFSIGDYVSFHANGRRVCGVITRYNRKTVTIMTDCDHKWTVSPGLLQAAVKTTARPTAATASTACVVAMAAGLPAGNAHGSMRV